VIHSTYITDVSSEKEAVLGLGVKVVKVCKS